MKDIISERITQHFYLSAFFIYENFYDWYAQTDCPRYYL